MILRSRLARVVLGVGLLSTSACGAAAGSAGASASPEHAARPASRGTLLIVGGGAQPPALVERFVQLAGGPGRARIAVVPMASGTEGAGKEKAEDLRKLGAEAFVLDLTRAQAETDSAARMLEGVTGIWYGGGDQVRLARVLAGTPTLRAMRARYEAGAVVGGTSAGAAVMTDSMLTGDQARPGVDTVGYFGDEFPRIARRAIEVAPGFGFLSGAIVDQHFIRRERANRLVAAVLERPTLIGVGIDEGTALRVDPDGRWAVEGASAVLVVDARRSRITPGESAVLGASSIAVHLLPAGSTYDPARAVARLPGE